MTEKTDFAFCAHQPGKLGKVEAASHLTADEESSSDDISNANASSNFWDAIDFWEIILLRAGGLESLT